VTFTIPRALRGLFERDRRLLSLLVRCAYEALRRTYQAALVHECSRGLLGPHRRASHHEEASHVEQAIEGPSEDAINSWKPKPTRERGGQRRFSAVAIETALTLRLVFHLPLRQTEGFLRSLFALMDLDLEVPDHTTLSRRARSLNVRLRRPDSTGPIHLVIDSSGLSFVGEGE